MSFCAHTLRAIAESQNNPVLHLRFNFK